MRRTVVAHVLIKMLENVSGVSWAGKLVFGSAEKILSGLVLSNDLSSASTRAINNIRMRMKEPVALSVYGYGDMDWLPLVEPRDFESFVFLGQGAAEDIVRMCCGTAPAEYIAASEFLHRWHKTFSPLEPWVTFRRDDIPTIYIDMFCANQELREDSQLVFCGFCPDREE